MTIFQILHFENANHKLSLEIRYHSRDSPNDHFNKETTPIKDHFLARTEFSRYFMFDFTNQTGLLVRLGPCKETTLHPVPNVHLSSQGGYVINVMIIFSLTKFTENNVFTSKTSQSSKKKTRNKQITYFEWIFREYRRIRFLTF